MNYLLAGSYAYDTILIHKGEFHAKILPESLSRLNVAFTMDTVEDEFGGTAGNIAYNAHLLGQSPHLIGCLGKDGQEYQKRLANFGLDTSTLTYYSQEKTAHAWIMTDTINNQITGFNAGAMKHRPQLQNVTPELWHLSADNPNTTSWLAKEAIAQGKTYFFDPGQGLPYFIEDAPNNLWGLSKIIENATGIFVNEYESEMLMEKTQKTLAQLVEKDGQFLIKTLGSKGVELYTKNGMNHVGVAKPNKIIDPTGCGDSFRAGFLYGYTNGYSLEACVQLGSTMGSFAIQESGGQNHKPTLEEIMKRAKECFGLNIIKSSKPKP